MIRKFYLNNTIKNIHIFDILYIHLMSCNLFNSPISSGSFYEDSSEYFNVLSENKDSFISSFPLCMPFISFS